jgi:hypothetical protein
MLARYTATDIRELSERLEEKEVVGRRPSPTRFFPNHTGMFEFKKQHVVEETYDHSDKLTDLQYDSKILALDKKIETFKMERKLCPRRKANYAK